MPKEKIFGRHVSLGILYVSLYYSETLKNYSNIPILETLNQDSQPVQSNSQTNLSWVGYFKELFKKT